MSHRAITVELPPGAGRPGLATGCPACGPLEASVTSRYCALHLHHLRAAWQAARGDRRLLIGASAS